MGNKKAKEIPNKESIEAFKELEDMQKHPEKYKTYSNVQEIIDEVKKEMENEEL